MFFSAVSLFISVYFCTEEKIVVCCFMLMSWSCIHAGIQVALPSVVTVFLW